MDDGNFTTAVSNIGTMNINAYWANIGSCYVDAVGYSWDPDHNIGDNLNEGILLSYDNTTSLDWNGYSLDGATNKTILGNTTILMPEDGPHSIQVFGNDSIDTMYESDLRYFSVNTAPPDLTINSPHSQSNDWEHGAELRHFHHWTVRFDLVHFRRRSNEPYRE